MAAYLARLASAFGAGAFGALINSLAVWAAGAYGLTRMLGVAIHPALSLDWLYPRITWGGLWGFLFLLPILPAPWWVRGLALSLAPSAVQLLYLYPIRSGHGLWGLELGEFTPLFVVAANSVWGLATAWLHKG